jgi:hypothetical protein
VLVQALRDPPIVGFTHAWDPHIDRSESHLRSEKVSVMTDGGAGAMGGWHKVRLPVEKAGPSWAAVTATSAAKLMRNRMKRGVL